MKLITLRTLSVLALTLCLTSTANATLLSRLGSTAFYDDVLDITWLDVNSGIKNWDEAKTWAAGRTDGGFTDWRLPTMVDTGTSGCNFSNNGTDCGYNVQTGSAITTVFNEMGSLFYDTLANNGANDTSGTFRGGSSGLDNGGVGGDWGLVNSGLFTNLLSNSYWTDLEYAPDPSRAWTFYFSNGDQGAGNKNDEVFALAVRSGDVAAVPVPAAVWLMGSALLGLAGFRRKVVPAQL